MELFRVEVEVASRLLIIHVKAGILATMEVGTIDNGVEMPTHKAVLIVGETTSGHSAWVQTSKFNGTSDMRIMHQGWIENGKLKSSGSWPDAEASCKREENPTNAMIACQENATFGMLACCTATAGNCYIRCCGACCSDPAGCPGATCCP